MDKKIADLRTDVTGVSSETATLSQQLLTLRDSLGGGDASSVSHTVQEHSDAIARLEQHSAQLLARKVSVDQELAEVNGKLQALSSKVGDQVSALEQDVARVVKSRPAIDDRLDKLDDKASMLQRQMSNLVDLKAVEHLIGIRMAREIHELEARLTQNMQFATEKLENKLLQSLEKQVAHSQRSEALAATIKSEIMDEMQQRFLSVSNGGLRKADLVPVQSAQTQLQEEVAQLASSLARQERKAQDATQATTAQLRDELAEARQELTKAIQTQHGRMTSALEEQTANSESVISKIDQQLSALAKKQKRMEEVAARLQENVVALHKEVNDKRRHAQDQHHMQQQRDSQASLRERVVAKSLAELESLVASKADIERQYQQQVSRHEARLAELRASLTTKETQMEAQRRELLETMQQETKRMGMAEGKNSVLTSLLAREKQEHEEMSELLRKSRKEINIVRQKLRDTESEASKRRQQLSSDLQAKQQQVRELTKKLQLSERESSKLLENAMREAKAIRRLKATKEHELLLAKMKLSEMERVSLAVEVDEEALKQVAEYAVAASANAEQAEMRREEVEQMLLASHLEIDGLRQELEFVSKELDVVKEQQQSGTGVEEVIAKVSREYEEKINALQQQMQDKESALSQLSDALADRSDLQALESELVALKEDKKSLLDAMQRAQEEHRAVEADNSSHLVHEKELAAMKQQVEARVSELDDAQAALEASKENILSLEKELERQKALHNDTVDQLTQEIKDARATIDSCSTEMLALKETKLQLESELAQLESKIAAEEEEADESIDDQSAQADKEEAQRVRDELESTLQALSEKEEQLQQAKKCDEDNRQQLVAMAASQNDMERRYLEQLETLSQTLKQERECSQCREQDMASTVVMLSSEVSMLKAESQQAVESSRAEWMTQMASLSDSLKVSQTHEQKLQRRLQRILSELSAAAKLTTSSGEALEDSVTDENEDADIDAAMVKQCLKTLHEQQLRTSSELDKLQAEHERAVAKAASENATAQSLASQVDGYTSQIQDLESEVARLEEQLKDEYAKSAAVAKCSGDIEDEVVVLRKQKRELEEQVDAKSAEYNECVAAFQDQVDAKQSQVEELLEQNAALNTTIETVRQKMDAVEAEKARELDGLREQMLELETRAEDLHRGLTLSGSEQERSFYANHQEIVALAQDARATFEKLTSGCGVLEWSDIRASLFAKEEVTERLFMEKSRELSRIQTAEQQVLLNTDFLNAWVEECAESEDAESEGDNAHWPFWLSKYATLAPEVVRKLQGVEATLQDAAVSLENIQTLEASMNDDGLLGASSASAVAAASAVEAEASMDKMDALAAEYESHKGPDAVAAEDHEEEDKVSNVSTDETDDVPASHTLDDDDTVAQPPTSQDSDTRGQLLSQSLSGMVEDYFDPTAVDNDEDEKPGHLDRTDASQDMDEVERLLLAQSGDQSVELSQGDLSHDDALDGDSQSISQSGADESGEHPSPATSSHAGGLNIGVASGSALFKFSASRNSGHEDDEDDDVERLMSASLSAKTPAHDDEFDAEFGDDDFDHANANVGSGTTAPVSGHDEEYLEESFDLEESLQNED